ncbi:MAG: prolyl oligopeptidase family serine peptidase [Planctomycetes bacterium]|nr:prolyl oligopeptidase family serine peptidase [Planctomycetota bacterium]
MSKRCLRIVVALVVLCVSAAGCAINNRGPIRVENYRQAIRVACVGDSTTYGSTIKYRLRDCYPAQLGRMLGDKFQTRNFGVSGATLLKKGDKPYWKQQAFKDALAFNPHVVVIKLGTNDTKPKNWKFKDQFVGDYKDMIDSFASLPTRPRIWICYPVPAYPEPWGISDERIRNEVIPLVAEVAKETRAGVIDLHKPLSDKPQLFPDLIHPNAEGALLMAQEIYRVLTGRPVTSEAQKPALANVLIIGDSISIGYFGPTKQLLKGKAVVVHNPGNAQHTRTGLTKLDDWLGQTQWDVIHFNHGLHDLKYVDKNGRNTSVAKGKQQIPIEQYEKNLEQLVQRLKKTGAELIFATTTPVPDGTGIRVQGDAGKYNAVARKVMNKHGIAVNDLYSYALPRLSKIQMPQNVHFHKLGSYLLAEQVSAGISQKLEGRQGGTQTFSTTFPGSKSDWNGYDRYDFEVDGRKCCVVAPKVAAPGRPWIWRARFFGHEPQVDTALLSRGFHLSYMDVAGLFGSPRAVAHWNAFYRYLTENFALSDRVALEGMSRGGLIVYNWAAANPNKVSCIYADAPVCDFKSWPGGKGKGRGSPADWTNCLKAYGLTEKQAMNYKKNPIDNLRLLAAAGIPLLHMCGDADEVVPIEENTRIVEKRYKRLGGSITTITKEGVGHHPHSLEDPKPIVEFICRHTGLSRGPFYALRDDLSNCRLRFLNEKKGRVAFLGGSITNMNGWRPMVAENLQKRFPDTEFDFVNAGIPSTDSTLGPFRLSSDVFGRGRVDLLFVEYAVNDQHNSRAAVERIRGMEGVIRQARRKNPYIDIVMLYFVDPIKIEQLNSGHTPPEVQSHRTVARYYDIPAIDLAREVAERLNTSEFDWGTFGGLHPGPFGHRLYAESIERLFDAAWKTRLSPDSKPRKHFLPASPIDPLNYSRGRYIDIEQANLVNGFQHVPSWATKQGSTRPRFREIPMLVAEQPGAALELDFSGTAIGILVVAGPDVGVIEFSIDGGKVRQLDQLTRWSSFLHIPWAYMLDAELKPGSHKLTLKTTDKKHPNSKGHAARIVKFLAN